MKRIGAGLLALVLLLGLLGCTGEEDLPQTEPISETQPLAHQETLQETPTETETEPLTGELYFTVSKITFPLVGDSEDIYIGTAPRERITWESSDEKVVKVEDGVLTAVGVGETTVRAVYGNQEMSCTVGCLAEDEDSLKKLDREILRSPIRFPPEVPENPHPMFADSAIIGDSISYILFQNESRLGGLGHPLFLARGGISVYGLIRYFSSVLYQGKEKTVEEAVEKSGVKRVFIMLGQNDLGYRSVDNVIDSWDVLVEHIREKSPDVEIYIQSVVPEWQDDGESSQRNDKIREHNLRLREHVKELGCEYIEIADYIEDSMGRMAEDYSLDNSIHLNPEGCEIWMQALNAYAYWRDLEGAES